MPLVRTQINCPQCRQPIAAEIEQLFDAGQDPGSKQRLLSGQFNLAQCPHCGYAGNLATPMIYHDPSKELLLTFFPPELNMTRDEQEQVMGPMIKSAVDSLPQEERKGYLFNPQATFTMQGLIERVLEADGITKEMIEAQRNRSNLISRMVEASEEELAKIATEEDENIDAEFFTLLSRMAEVTMSAGDEASVKKLAELQQALLSLTTFGRQIKAENDEVEAASQSLQELGEELTREKLIELVIEAPTETRVRALVSMARPAFDYVFFQTFTEQIDAAEGEEKEKLEGLRENLLAWTQELDLQLEARMAQTQQLIEQIIQTENIQETMAQALPAVDDFFIQALSAELEAATQKDDQERMAKLQEIVAVIQQASQAPPEVALIQELLEAEDDAARQKIMEEKAELVNDQFLQTLTGLLPRVEAGEDEELKERMLAVHKAAVGFSMKAKLAQKD